MQKIFQKIFHNKNKFLIQQHDQQAKNLNEQDAINKPEPMIIDNQRTTRTRRRKINKSSTSKLQKEPINKTKLLQLINNHH